MRTDFLSYADLQRMPDDGRQYELYDGEVRVVPSPVYRLATTARATGVAVSPTLAGLRAAAIRLFDVA